jgi:hypothetical protein
MDSSIVLFPLYAVILLVVAFVIVWIVASNFKPRQTSQTSAYGVASVTQRGVTVRTIAERRIADYFEENNINYVYEPQVIGRTTLSRYRITRPDFLLPDYDVIVEYWGLVDAEDNRTSTEYVRNMRRKMAIYHRNNIKFISIYPRNLDNLDWIFRAKFRKTTGYELPNSRRRAQVDQSRARKSATVLHS